VECIEGELEHELVGRREGADEDEVEVGGGACEDEVGWEGMDLA
jgi:hypothetical protein